MKLKLAGHDNMKIKFIINKSSEDKRESIALSS